MTAPPPPPLARPLLGGLLVILAICSAIGIFAWFYTASGRPPALTDRPAPGEVLVVPAGEEQFLYLSGRTSRSAEGCQVVDADSGRTLALEPLQPPLQQRSRGGRVYAVASFASESGRVRASCDDGAGTVAGVGPAFDTGRHRLLAGATLVVPTLLGYAAYRLLRVRPARAATAAA